MNHTGTSDHGTETRGTGLVAWSIGPAFGLLAAWFIVSSPRADLPLVEQPAVERARFAPVLVEPR